MENLRQKLRDFEDEIVKTEQRSREENSLLLKRLEEAEARNEELSQSSLEVSKPLVRQLESLQATYNIKLSGFEKVEEDLTMKLSKCITKSHASCSEHTHTSSVFYTATVAQCVQMVCFYLHVC